MKNYIVNIVTLSLFSLLILGCNGGSVKVNVDPTMNGIEVTLDPQTEIGTVLEQQLRFTNLPVDVQLNDMQLILRDAFDQDDDEYFTVALKQYGPDAFGLGYYYGELTLARSLSERKGETFYFKAFLVINNNSLADQTVSDIVIHVLVDTPTVGPDLQKASDTGTSDEDNITSDSTPTFDIPNCVDGLIATLYIDDIKNGQITCSENQAMTISNTDNGNYSVQYTLRTTEELSQETGKSPALEFTIDTTKPIISLNGDNQTFVEDPNDPVIAYIELGASVSDNDSSINSNDIVIAGASSVDRGTPGTYIVRYNIQDSAGNAANEVTRTVIITPISVDTQTIPIVWFDEAESDTGRELWKSDGTVAGTVLVKNIRAGVAGSMYQGNFHKLNNQYYFIANDGEGGENAEIWMTNLEGESTRLVKNIQDGNWGDPSDLTIFNGHIYFFALESQDNFGLWRTTANGTDAEKVAPLPKRPRNMRVFNNKLIFGVTDSGSQNLLTEPWVSDGDVGGTTEVLKQIRGGGNGSDFTAESMIELDGRLYGGANGDLDGINYGKELWRTNRDGTTALFSDINEGNAHSSPAQFTTGGNNFFYFVASTVDNPYALWRSNGGSANVADTFMIKDVDPSSSSSDKIQQLTYVNGTLYFLVNRKELWKSNGDANGTELVKNLVVDDNSAYPEALINYNNKLYFFADADDGTGITALWTLDASGEPTKVMKLLPDYTLEYNSARVEGGLIYLEILNKERFKTELWRSDGQTGAEHTFKLKDGQLQQGEQY